MTDHEIILKMIETVDPDDSVKLDEIDLAVYKYIGELHMMLPKVTRSRDALKAIRPDGWDCRVCL